MPDANAALQPDVLELADATDDLYLSDVDEPRPKVKSVVIKVVNEPRITENSKRSPITGNRIECSVSGNREETVPKRHRDKRSPNDTQANSADLFPHPPRRVSGDAVFDSRYRIPRKPVQQLTEFDLFARKRSSQSKHSSNNPRSRDPRIITAREKHFSRAQSQQNQNHSSVEALEHKRDRLRIAIERVKQKPPPVRRTVKPIGPSFTGNRPRIDSNPFQRSVQIVESPFARLEPPTPASTFVPPTQRNVATQTEPCRCQRLLKAKNKKRREIAKKNRDIVRRMNESNETK